MNRVFFPAGLLVDPSAGWLYVVNSNSDLRYNGGTVAAIDLGKVAEDRAGPWPECPANTKLWRAPFSGRLCCRDRLDARILDCDDRGYIDATSTVRIGSFGGAIVGQGYERAGESVQRLFVTVRSDPSVSFIDATVSEGRVSMRCTGPRQGGALPAPEPTCSSDWRIQGATQGDVFLKMPEEPYALALDPTLGVLYVGHLFGGVSTVDVCAPTQMESPRLAAVTRIAFPANPQQGVTSLFLAAPGHADVPVLATSRFSTEIAEMLLRDPAAASCDPAAPPVAPPRDLTAVPGPGFSSTAFFPYGRDLRGVVLSPDRQRAFVLHRNDPFSRQNPAAVVIIDRRPGASLRPVDRPVDVVEVCPGPTELKMHDAGRGPRLFVTCFDAGQIYVIDPELLVVVAIIDAGRGPNTIVFPPDKPTIGYVAGFTDNTVLVLDLQPGSPTEHRVVQRLGFPHLSTQ